MKAIKTVMLCIIMLIPCKYKIIAQDTLKITISQAEKRFLDENLQLLAERCNIDMADAAIAQAKLLNNPTIGAGDINFWHPNAAEELAISPASFGNRIAFSLELEQMIRTAGKRRKLVDLEKVSKEIAVLEFESFVLNLKTELRTNLLEATYLQSYLEIIKIQQKSIADLVESYKKNLSGGNIAKSELMRLQASLIELETESNELLAELHKQYKSLKMLLNIAPETEISISPAGITSKNPDEILLSDLLEMAKYSHPEFKLSDLNISYNEKLLVYEKSQRVPDLGLSFSFSV